MNFEHPQNNEEGKMENAIEFKEFKTGAEKL